MKKKNLFYNLIGIPLIAIAILFACTTKAEASIADFVATMESGNAVSTKAKIEVKTKWWKRQGRFGNSWYEKTIPAKQYRELDRSYIYI